MKKIAKIVLTSAAILTASQAMAKTEGNYFGFDISQNRSSHQYDVQTTLSDQTVNLDDIHSSSQPVLGSFKENEYGYGINLKHAFNYEGVFLAPSIFYEKIGTSAEDSLGDQVSINSRHGAKLDIGYDVMDNLAFYVTGGVAVIDYEINFNKTGLGNVNGKESSFIKGVGLNYSLNKDWLINFEYNSQKADLEGKFLATGLFPGATSAAGVDTYNVKTQINSYKFGLAYRF